MLSPLIAGDDFGHRMMVWIDGAATAIEILAVAIIILVVFYSVGRYLFQAVLRPKGEDLYRELKARLGKTLLLGLEILVAADIVRTYVMREFLQEDQADETLPALVATRESDGQT